METIIELIKTMDVLKTLNSELIKMLQYDKPSFIGFNIERITIESEKSVIQNGIDTLQVTNYVNETQRNTVINSLGSYYKEEGFSTKFVDRVPGIIVVTENQDEVIQLIHDINSAKNSFAKIVREGRDQYERHKFIHDNFRFIMTEQVYRHIQYFEEPVTNVWFNWASRPVPKKYSINDAVIFLESQLERPKQLMSNKEWDTMIHACINEVRSGGFDYIQRNKQFRVLPTIELQYLTSENEIKRRKSNATTPFILLGQKKNVLPKYSILSSYINKNKNKQVTLKPNKTMLNPYLKLVGVKSIYKE